MGVLFDTGLLITNPVYGIGLLAAVVARLFIGRKPMEVREAGFIVATGYTGL